MLTDHLFLIDVDVELRDMRDKCCECGCDLRSLANCGKERIRITRKEVAALSGTVFQNKAHSAGTTNSRNGGWGNGKSDAILNLGETLVQLILNSRCLQTRGMAGVPVTQLPEKNAGVGVLRTADQVNAADCGHAFDTRRVAENILRFTGGFEVRCKEAA